MFRTAELGRKVSRTEFEQLTEPLRTELLELQQRLLGADFPVIVLFAGVDGAGKSESINLINEWMDPRWIVTRAYGPASDEERERPEFWRYWRDLPPCGRVGLFLSSWYSRPFRDRAVGHADEAAFDKALERVAAFERTLADDGALILKFWMHLGKEAQRQRFKALEKDPLQSWRVTPADWENWGRYDAFIAAAERLLQRTSVGYAPWQIVEGQDHRYRSLTILTTLRDAIRRHLEERAVRRVVGHAVALAEEEAAPADPRNPSPMDTDAPGHAPLMAASGEVDRLLSEVRRGLPSILDRLPTDLVLDKETYAVRLAHEQGRLNLLMREARTRQVSTVLVFEGWDAAGKGGAIRRLTQALDARDYQVIPVAAPSDEEKAHHYLWRFWRHLSRAGRVLIFDRSWYGRVLVERVEGFAQPREWRRAYAEIRDFEEQLVEHGIVLAKFWMHITRDEQLSRFKARETIPYKRWKLTSEDWRNREKWDQYEDAINDMIERTSTSRLPWTLVEAGDKHHARVKVLTTVCEALEARLGVHINNEPPRKTHADKEKSKKKEG
ncbi:polyphosphate kinase [Pararhodospirillum oryzae]|uniref:Polyphosphate--AMP phosphotransferase n=1 Tax=Pararhodospirillum oryzae TaxID=478448 RepID=A0A512HBA9_9PROT|nr:polyphosphate kinase [Pararhodospirillum oryzae]GEO82741.1 polyphosphate--AMP phosphotransferase [Pararhodospirillum oryzae]